ncbi:MAG: leucyl aminopeptidase family protein, partial [Pseudorhodoplanes sp.]
MHPVFADSGRGTAIPIWFVTKSNWPAIRESLTPSARGFAEAAGFDPKPGSHFVLPGSDSGIGGVIFGLEDEAASADLLLAGKLPGLIPAGTYRFANAPHDARLAALAFALGTYRFERYRKRAAKSVTLVCPDGVDAADLSRIGEGVALARDLINTPSNDMGPAELHEATRLLAERHDAWIEAVTDDELLLKNFPLIHAVGRVGEGAEKPGELHSGGHTHPQTTLRVGG